ncbi:MAG: NYN domain-containing protein, partial [Ilumatobacteraceae bacterium]
PIGLPGGVFGTSLEAAQYLARHPGVLVVVDGYNVAKLRWPSIDLEQQREQCVAACEDVSRRYGTDLTVVFDGSTVPGGSTGAGRLVRVVFSPEGVTADDVIRDIVGGLSVDRGVVVVTNDKAIIVDVRTKGANPISSEQLLALSGR